MVRTYVLKDVEFPKVLEGMSGVLKVALAKHLGKLVLTPVMRDGRPVYRVTGDVTIPDPEECRIQLVARDGIGTPTAVDCS